MSKDPDSFRKIMRRWSTGVTIVTSTDGTSAHGMTVNSFTSVSLEPPLVLVSLERDTRTRQIVLDNGRFAVSILDKNQQVLAERFAGRIPDEGDRGMWLEKQTGLSKIPVPPNYLATMECEVLYTHEAGTHTLFVAKVMWGEVSEVGRPLLYYNQEYRQLAD
ncbi:MAG: flavin reductase [Anaerolineales bacterium]|nr:flavin reductase [Anaerolineales bacterium]